MHRRQRIAFRDIPEEGAEMHRRHQAINLPTEIVRTVVVIAETGSYSKAGAKLGLSQPAITAQIKRLQIMIGGPAFARVSGGVALTERGKLMLSYARRLLEANDQILALGGAAQDNQPLRIGLTPIYVEAFLSLYASVRSNVPVNFHCDTAAEIAKGITDGYVDLACVLGPPPDLVGALAGWQEPFVWVRGESFALMPGAPIPIVTWQGSATDSVMIGALERAGLAYRVVFASVDLNSRMAAVAAGLGVMLLPCRLVRAPLWVADTRYLPPLDGIPAAVAVRPGLRGEPAGRIADLLRALAPGREEAAA
jgi:DNA-binding transcriptional LysR family regulator